MDSSHLSAHSDILCLRAEEMFGFKTDSKSKAKPHFKEKFEELMGLIVEHSGHLLPTMLTSKMRFVKIIVKNLEHKCFREAIPIAISFFVKWGI